jgi:outer membrane protein assembly factor BamE
MFDERFRRDLRENNMFRLFGAVAVLLALSGCSTYEFPGVHRITVQQGNVVTQAMIDKLKPGMTKRQVQFVLGNPVIDDQLNRNRWDYVYTIDIPGVERIQQTLQVYFVDDRLSHFSGDYAPTEAKDALASHTSDP